ncbi:MAG: ABC transporter permease [Halodesulfurarchaeum sp.]
MSVLSPLLAVLARWKSRLAARLPKGPNRRLLPERVRNLGLALRTRGIEKRVILGTAAVSTAVLVLIPLVFLLWSSVWSGYPGDFSGAFTLQHFVEVYLEGAYDAFGLFSNSLFVAAGMATIAMGFGLSFAWLLVRTNLPTKGAMELVLISPYAVPVYIYAIMYIATYGPDNGLVMTHVMNLFGLETAPFDIFSPGGIVFIVGLNAVTTFYLLTAPALQNMDPALEEVSRIHGASIARTVRSISFPLILPAIFSALLVTFLRGLGEFSVVAILGARDGFDVYATAIWAAVTLRAPPEYGQAAALSFSLIVVTAVLVWYYRKLTARKEDFMTVTSRGRKPRTWDLGRWRWPIAAGLWVVLFVVWILPILVMVLVALHGVWYGSVDPSNLTLVHFAEAVTQPRLRRAFFNSVAISVGGATLGTGLVVLTAYYTERTTYRFRGLVEFLSLSPLAVPGIIMGTGLIFASLWIGKLHDLVDIYGTLWIIMIGSIIVFIPVSSRIAVGNIVQIHSELEESARVFGASWLQQLREVLLPLFKNTTAVLWFYLLIHIFQLLTIPIMTYTSGTEVIPVTVFNLWTKSANLELVSAISTIFIALTLGVLLVFRARGIAFYQIDGK